MRFISPKIKYGLVFILLALITIGSAAAQSMNESMSSTPEGFEKVLVFMANGELNTSDTMSAPSPDSFYRNVMNFTPEQMVQEQANAEQFFMEHYGIDFSNVEAVNGTKTIDGSAELSIFTVDPRNNYRAYYVSGEDVPNIGWEVRDGGWQLMFMNDTLVKGAFGGQDGKLLPAGSMSVYGYYSVDRPGQNPIIIHYQSFTPMVPNVAGVPAIDCNITDPMWGVGRATGAVQPAMDMGNGIMKQNWRNVLTFPAY